MSKENGNGVVHHHHFHERTGEGLIRAYNIPAPAATKLQDFFIDLRSQQVPIRGVVVDNMNSGTPVYVYEGVCPLGNPYVVLPGWSRGFAIAQSSAIYVTFPSTTTATPNPGSIYIAVFDEPIVAFSTQNSGSGGGGGGPTGDVFVTNFPAVQPVSGNIGINNFPTTQPVSGTVNIGNQLNPQPVSGTVLVGNLPATQPVSGTVGVNNFPATQPVTVGNFPATQPVSGTVSVTGSVVTVGNFPATQAVDLSGTGANAVGINVNPVQYPLASLNTRIVLFQTFQLTSASAFPIQLLTQPATGQAAFFTNIMLAGFNKQPAIEWNLQGRNTVGAYSAFLRGWRDRIMIFSGPYFICPSTNVAQGIYLNAVNASAILGTLNVDVAMMGWWATPQ